MINLSIIIVPVYNLKYTVHNCATLAKGSKCIFVFFGENEKNTKYVGLT